MFQKICTTLFIVGIVCSASMVAAWTNPTGTPPQNNVAAPLNVSNVAQNKQGVLTVGGLGIFGPAIITPTAGYSLPSSLNLGVNGKIGASAYCDKNGNNCVSTLAGGVATTANVSGSSKAWVTFRNIGGTISQVGDAYGVTSVTNGKGVSNFSAYDTIIKLDSPLLTGGFAVVASPAYDSGSGYYKGSVLDWVCIWSKISSDTIGVHCAYPGYGQYGNSIVSVVVF
ncbi:MAG: hypothetical protein FGM57_01160 [Candidatus Taylorbacteria bacterium]|nr:hypothetical protein [Candidatus Taylorbacteria bacterium]